MLNKCNYMELSNSVKRKHSEVMQQEPTNNKRSHSEDYEAYTDTDDIKQFSSDQRLALPDEPVCVVCGKYGEYINDETDQDICSLQCKAINSDLNSKKRTKKIKKVDKESIINTLLHDYVAANLHAKLTSYQEPPSVASMSSQQVQQMLKAHDMEVSGHHIPKPFTTFDQLGEILGPKLLANIESLGWSMATGVQRQAVTVGLAGRDMNVVAPTHAGKTGAFLIPTIVHCISLSALDNYKRRAGPYAMIMAPTRELCSQIEKVCQRLSKGLRNIRTGLLIGGEPLPNQLYRLKKGVQIVIGTPGRVLEMATQHPKLLRTWKIQILVVDEADAMFSMGFGAQVRQILGKFPDTTIRQTCLFSATMSSSDHKVLHKRLKSPIEIKVSQKPQEDDEPTVLPEASDHVRQTVIWVEDKSKAKRLFTIIKNPKYFVVPILVFVASKLGAEFLTRAIQKKMPHLRVVAMHGDKTQEERDGIIEGINQAEPFWDVIVSTDVLARGVNLPTVRLVINYDMAATLEEYVHRIGRAILKQPTAKQKMGWSITFINQEHDYLVKSFALMLSRKTPAQVTPLPPQLKRYITH